MGKFYFKHIYVFFEIFNQFSGFFQQKTENNNNLIENRNDSLFKKNLKIDNYFYLEENNPNLRIDPYMGTYFYRINTTNEVLKDVNVRKALAYAINRTQIVEKVSKCGQKPAYSFTPPGSANYYPDTEVPFDPVLANTLLAAAGYPNGEGFPKLEILFNT